MIFRKSGTEEKKIKSLLWVWAGAFFGLAAAVIFVALYPFFRNLASAEVSNPIEEKSNIGLLYGCNQILYRDLYNTLHKTSLDYMDLYYPVKEECQAEIDGWEKWLLYAEEPDEAAEHSETEDDAEGFEEAAEQRTLSDLAEYEQYLDQKENMRFYFNEVEAYFRDLSEMYDYEIRDLETGMTLTNAVTEDLEDGSDYYFLLEFVYDAQGNMTVGNLVKGEDSGQIRRYAADLARCPLASDTGTVYNVTYGDGRFDRLFQCVQKRFLSNCSIRYGMKENVWTQIKSGTADYPSNIRFYGDAWRSPIYLYYNVGVGKDYLLFVLALFLLGLLLPFVDRGKPWRVFPVCRMIPLEGILAGGAALGVLEDVIVRMVANANQYHPGQSISIPFLWTRLYNILFLALLFFAAWYLGISLRLAREIGVKEYVKQKCLFYLFFPFLKSRVIGFYRSLENFDLTGDTRKRILKIVLVNAVILFIISSLWVGGFFITAVYSVLLYFLLVRYISGLQKKYEILLKATNEIASGNLNVTIPENIGVFEPFKPQIYRIQQGFKRAVEEEVKSQRMKAELITNVSHDLKTPLTAIITYIGLLKEEDITEEQREEYLDTLERKSLRLKVLIEDLFEISKATSKAIRLNIVDVDIFNLVKQVEFEMSDKLAAAGLEVRMNLPEERVLLPLDSQKTFRIYENLYGNIAKYALTGTRVYVSGRVTPQEVVITLKNISREELTMDVSELTDRFVRGDASRNTEGSGLGLAIAKSFTELQGGGLELELEDDLFKVITRWKRPTVPEISEWPK